MTGHGGAGSALSAGMEVKAMGTRLYSRVSRWCICFAFSLLAGLWLAAGSASADSGSRVAPYGGGAHAGLPICSAATICSTAPICTIAAETPGAVLVAHVNWQGIAQPNSRNTTETL